MAKSRLESLNSDVQDNLDRLDNPTSLIPEIRQAETRHADLIREIEFQQLIVGRALARIEAG